MIMMKMKLLVIFVIIFMVVLLIPNNKDNNELISIEQPIEIINCSVNNKYYEYNVFYKDNKYVVLSNEYLLSDIETNTEEELRNIIESIFVNKNGKCYVDTIENIEINF